MSKPVTVLYYTTALRFITFSRLLCYGSLRFQDASVTVHYVFKIPLLRFVTFGENSVTVRYGYITQKTSRERSERKIYYIDSRERSERKMDISIHAPRERKKHVLFLLRFANGSVMVCYVSTKKSVMVCYGNMRICYGLLRERENLLWFVVQNPLLFLLRNQKIPVMVCYGYTKICYSCNALLDF